MKVKHVISINLPHANIILHAVLNVFFYVTVLLQIEYYYFFFILFLASVIQQRLLANINIYIYIILLYNTAHFNFFK